MTPHILFRYLLAVVLSGLLLSACSESDNPVEPAIDLTAGSLVNAVTDQAQTLPFTFVASMPWTATTSDPSWCKISATSGQAGEAHFSINLSANSAYESREAEVTLLIDGTAMKTLSVTQAQKNGSLLVLKFTGATLQVPYLTDGYKGLVNWGDGSSESFAADLTHTFKSASKTHTVSIEGEAASSFELAGIEGVDEIDITHF